MHTLCFAYHNISSMLMIKICFFVVVVFVFKVTSLHFLKSKKQVFNFVFIHVKHKYREN